MTGSWWKDHRTLREQILNILNFYYPDCIDTRFGGYRCQLDTRDGHLYDGRTKHLVATARATHNFSLGTALGGPDWCRAAAERGIQSLRTAHWDSEDEGFDWILDGRETADDTRFCYGHAFVLLAAARAVEAEVADAESLLSTAHEILIDRFWEPEYGLFADRATDDWSSVDSYRGQNANMHACEALIAAYEATGEATYVDRAYDIAESLARDLAAETDGWIWEHYTDSWEHDFEYNRDQLRHKFRPWGYQPGHHVEWSKLLSQLDQHCTETWLAPRAEELFDIAAETGWDTENGGFYYTFDREGDPLIEDKYGWAVAEGIGAAALLADREGDYANWYDRFWEYAWKTFVNHRYGNWYEQVGPEGKLPEENHSPAVEPGYHPMNNAYLAMDSLS